MPFLPVRLAGQHHCWPVAECQQMHQIVLYLGGQRGAKADRGAGDDAGEFADSPVLLSEFQTPVHGRQKTA